MVEHQLTPPGISGLVAVHSEAPASSGGFLDGEQATMLETGNDRGRALVTPTDEHSGLPYPIAPGESTLARAKTVQTDPHHHFHPGKHPFFKTVAGIALRNSRLQAVDVRHHNQGRGSYHAYFRGPELPAEPAGVFRVCLFAVAGYIPSKGIDMSSGEPKIVQMSRDQLRWLRTPSRIDEFGYQNLTYNYDPIRRFFTSFALDQDFSQLDQRAIDVLLHTNDEEEKHRMAKKLLGGAVRLAVEPVRDEYEESHEAGRMHPRIKREPEVLVYYKIRNRPTPEKLTPRVERKAISALAA